MAGDPDYIRSLGPRPKAWLSVALAWVAGYVDAAGWFVFAHIYTSHMSGNTASLGQSVALAEWRKACSYGWPSLCFALGLIAGAFLIHIGKRRGFHSTLSLVLGLETLFLGLVVLLGLRFRVPGGAYSQSGWKNLLLVSLAAAAMGLQTVTLTRVGRMRVYTTYVTGSLSLFAESLAAYCLWVYDRAGGRFFRRLRRILRVSRRQESFQHLVLTAGLWAGFGAGAVCGALGLQAWDVLALCVPITILLLLTLVDRTRPVSLAHEQGSHFWLQEMLPPKTELPANPQKRFRIRR